MDHRIAMENHTAERYVLDELNTAEREAYEEHFFCCTICADEIKSASDFIETARHVIQNELKVEVYTHAARRSIWGSWLNWRSMLQPIPAAACALLVTLAGVVGYQNSVTIPQLAKGAPSQSPAAITAQLITPKPFLISESRGGGTQPMTVPENRAFILQFDIVDAGFDSYTAEITAEPNTPKFSLPISKNDTANPVQVVVPAGILASGQYHVVIRGVNRGSAGSVVKGEVAHFSFDLNVQD